MWFKNKKTGLKWEVDNNNKELIKRLSKDENYEEFKIQDITETEFNNMKKAELLQIAKENNIEVDENMIRKDLIKALKEAAKKVGD